MRGQVKDFRSVWHFVYKNYIRGAPFENHLKLKIIFLLILIFVLGSFGHVRFVWFEQLRSRCLADQRHVLTFAEPCAARRRQKSRRRRRRCCRRVHSRQALDFDIRWGGRIRNVNRRQSVAEVDVFVASYAVDDPAAAASVGLAITSGRIQRAQASGWVFRIGRVRPFKSSRCQEMIGVESAVVLTGNRRPWVVWVGGGLGLQTRARDRNGERSGNVSRRREHSWRSVRSEKSWAGVEHSGGRRAVSSEHWVVETWRVKARLGEHRRRVRRNPATKKLKKIIYHISKYSLRHFRLKWWDAWCRTLCTSNKMKWKRKIAVYRV